MLVPIEWLNDYIDTKDIDISKIESGKMDIVESDYELSSLVVDCYNMIIERVYNNNVVLVKENNNSSPFFKNNVTGVDVKLIYFLK